jgi:hypothetical protein
MTTVTVIGGQTVRSELEVDPLGRFSQTHQADSVEAFNSFRRFQDGFYALAPASPAANSNELVQIPSISASRPTTNVRREPPAATRDARSVVVDIERARIVTASRERRIYTSALPPSPPSSPPPPLSRSVVSQPSECNTITSGDTLSISRESHFTSASSATNPAAIPAAVPTAPRSGTYTRFMEILQTAKAAERSTDALQGSSVEQLKKILMSLRTKMTQERKLEARKLFDQQMAINVDQLKNLREIHKRVRGMEYGSAWELDGIQPLETRVSTPVHLFEIF